MNMVLVGVLVNTHGIKGEVRIQSDFELANIAFNVGNTLTINGTKFEIASYRIHKNFHMVTFKGYDNINQVEYLKGNNVYINRDELKLEDGVFLLEDLIGLDVLINDNVIGYITDITNGINPLITVNDNKYIPYNDEFINKIDIDNNKVILSDKAKELL